MIETNIVLVEVGGTGIAAAELVELLAAAGVRALERDTSRIRFVTHRLIGDEDVERAAAIVGGGRGTACRAAARAAASSTSSRPSRGRSGTTT